MQRRQDVKAVVEMPSTSKHGPEVDHMVRRQSVPLRLLGALEVDYVLVRSGADSRFQAPPQPGDRDQGFVVAGQKASVLFWRTTDVRPRRKKWSSSAKCSYRQGLRNVWSA